MSVQTISGLWPEPLGEDGREANFQVKFESFVRPSPSGVVTGRACMPMAATSRSRRCQRTVPSGCSSSSRRICRICTRNRPRHRPQRQNSCGLLYAQSLAHSFLITS